MAIDDLRKNAEAQREFFNRLAPTWRVNDSLSKAEIRALLSPIPLKKGERVLDVACGAGVLDECLLSMGLSVDGIDIADKMIERAKENAANRGANYYVADFYTYTSQPYDCLLAFDCYPHFTDKRRFGERAYALLKSGGTLWIFFDQSKDSVNGRHSGHDRSVSAGLLSAEKEAEALSERFELIYLLDNGERYTLGFRKK